MKNKSYCSCGKILSRGSKTGKCSVCAPKLRTVDHVKLMKEGKLKGLNSESSKPKIKKYFLEKQQGRCAICGGSDTHNEKPLVFILDHINGDSSQNTEDNLRLVCPNCDSQLDTFKSKNIGRGRLYDRNYKRRNHTKNSI